LKPIDLFNFLFKIFNQFSFLLENISFWKLAWHSLSIYSSIDLDQVWRRHYWDSQADRLNRVTGKCGISGTKDRPHTLQRHNLLCAGYSLICCEDHFQPTTIEVFYPKQECWIMVANHIPWRRPSDFKRWCWQYICAH